MKVTKTFQFYEDPEHGWMKISKSALLRLGLIHLVDIMTYRRGDTFYLDEDTLWVFTESFRRVVGHYPKLVSNVTNKRSKIRSYNRSYYLADDEPKLDVVKQKIIDSQLFNKSDISYIKNADPFHVGYWLTQYNIKIENDFEQELVNFSKLSHKEYQDFCNENTISNKDLVDQVIDKYPETANVLGENYEDTRQKQLEILKKNR